MIKTVCVISVSPLNTLFVLLAQITMRPWTPRSVNSNGGLPAFAMCCLPVCFPGGLVLGLFPLLEPSMPRMLSALGDPSPALPRGRCPRDVCVSSLRESARPRSQAAGEGLGEGFPGRKHFSFLGVSAIFLREPLVASVYLSSLAEKS